MSELISKYKKVKETLRQKLQREPMLAEISKRLRLSMDKIGEMDMWMQKKASLEAPVGEDGESQLGDLIKSDDDSDTTKEVKERISHLLDFIGEREKKTLDLRFGINNGKPHTLAQVADILKVSRERVRQIEKEALRKLKKYALEEQSKEL
jgi:RNA polymerase primary sigma factor